MSFPNRSRPRSAGGESARRRRQFSLQTLLAVTGASAVFFGLLVRFGAMPAVLYLGVCAMVVAWRRATVVEFVIVALVILILWTLVTPSTCLRSREAERREQCRRNLLRIVTAMRQYEDDHGSLPPAFLCDEAGKPAHSWRVLLLPYLGYEALYRRYRFDEPWEGPHNRKLADTVVAVYRCPNDEGALAANTTSYVVVRGPGTAFPGSGTTTLVQIRRVDGLAETALLVETALSKIHWMQPEDLDLERMSLRVNDFTGSPSMRSFHGDFAYAAFGDRGVRMLAPGQVHARTMTIDDGKGESGRF